jgi:hypothetical protein
MARQPSRSTSAKKARQGVRGTSAKQSRATGTGSGTKSRSRAKRAARPRARSRWSTGSRIASLTAGRFRHGTAGASTPEAENQPPGDLAEILPSQIEEVEAISIRARREAQSMVGEELPGGTVAVPENDRVDEFAEAFGVERALGSPLRTSGEILDRRDRRRGGRKPPPTL